LGADLQARDYQFEIPLDISLKNKKLEMIRVLLKNPNLSLDEAKRIPGYGSLQDEIDYSQKNINQKLITFLESEGKTEMKARELFLSKGGNCNGWSFLILKKFN
jgi:hypothetical protein